MPMRTSAPEAGFTLIEMLLVLVILAMAANLILTRFHPAPPATALSDAAARLITARAGAVVGIIPASADVQPWRGGPVTFSADGTADPVVMEAGGRKLAVLATGGLRLAP